MRRALALALAALALPLVGAQSDLPPDCEASTLTYTCRFVVESGADASNAARPVYAFALPVFERTLATIVVARTGADHGWTFHVEERAPGEAPRVLSRSEHAQQLDGSTAHQQKTTHLLITRADASYALVFRPGNLQMQQGAVQGVADAPGTYRITYVAEALPEGVAPARPAATMADPHLVDVVGEVEAGDHDVVSAWFDDARLGDGLMDAHLRVRDLESVTFRSPTAAGLPHEETTKVEWKLAFAVGAAAYYVAWEARPEPDSGAVGFSCALRYESEAQTESEEILVTPWCEVDRTLGVFHATFPTRAIGSPNDGAVFEQTTARTRLFPRYGGPEVVDDGPDRKYDFALGGPRVWSELDGGRKDPPLPAPLAWYEDPLASENLPDTLQVMGTALAALTFAFGVVFVWRARRSTRHMLEQIDRIERANENDMRAALLELGRLESDLNKDFRSGRIREAQYQVAAQRIASVAARFALRRDLGLDDGVPGEARSIPVHGEPATERAQQRS